MELILPVGLGAAALIAGALVLARVAKRRAVKKKALLRTEWGDHLGAAKLFEESGDLRRAAQHYIDAGDRLRACELRLALKDPAGALEALRGGKPEDIEQGANLLEAKNALDRQGALALAQLARTAGLHATAGRLFERGGNAEEAKGSRLQEARSLAAAGKHLEASAVYKKLGEARAAAAAQAEAARREGDQARRRELAQGAAAALKQLGDVAAAAEALAVGGALDDGVQMLRDLGNLTGAAQLLQWHGEQEKAALLFLQANDPRAAARAYQLAGKPAEAAAALERAGDCLGAAKLLVEAKDFKGAADVHLRAGSAAAAAELLVQAGDLDGAVKIWSDAGDLEPAVEALCKRGRVRDAAALLEQRGQSERAAAMLADAGDLAQRAKLLQAKGDNDGAAQALLEIGKAAEARHLLSKGTLSPMGRFLLGRACMACNDFLEASQHFAAALDNPPRNVSRQDVLYGMARAFEAQGRAREAITILQEIQQSEPGYRDASFRTRLLQARLEVAPGGGLPPFQSAPMPLNSPADLPVEWGGAGLPHPADDHRTGVPPRYVVERELGRGAMGVVYRALDSQLGRTVAIKVLDAKAGADPRMRDYFLREARAVAQLVHPNIVTLFDAGLEGTAPYLVMELVEGEDLRNRLQRGPLPMREAAQLIAAVASALDYAHARKIVHRDVKPENILVGADGAPKLMDFGVAHVMRESGDRRATVIGTPVYMAPEQIKGEGIGGFTDTYALGGVLYECLVGAPPFDPNGALYHHVNTPVPDPRQWRPEITDELLALMMSCLAKDPADRPASAKAVSEKLLSLAAAMQAA